MKNSLFALVVLGASSMSALAITVTTPVNNAQVASVFSLIASSTTCGGSPTVSMGYSIDSGAVTPEPTSFSAMVSATTGPHILHVKCWGQTTRSQVLLNITVVSSSTSASYINVTSPANGANITSPFNLIASTTTCNGIPATSMGYSLDGGAAVGEASSFSTFVSGSLGTHTLVVTCYANNVQDQVSLSFNVVAPPGTATPEFSVASGISTSPQAITISDATPGAAIYYTTDGTSPTTSSLLYTGAILVTSSTVIEAVALAPGYSMSGLARVSITIAPRTQAPIPSNAIAVTNIQGQSNWRLKYDPGTNGTASGATSMVSDPSLSGQAREFDTTYTYYGGVLYSVPYANDATASNFVYDVEVWIDAGSQLANLEMDNNQALSNGDTIIYSFQCSGNAKVWEYGENAGTAVKYSPKWVKSSAPCNPATWATNTWHHIQISYSRDDVGNATYNSVWLDGVEAPINATVFADFSLRWGIGSLVANFQVDGTMGSGSSTLYADNLTLYRWLPNTQGSVTKLAARVP